MFYRHRLLRAVACALALSAAMSYRAAALDVARTEVLLDTFATAKRYERRPPYAWRSDGSFRVGGDEALLMPPIASQTDIEVTADVRMAKRAGDGWGYAGVAIRLDPANSWMLLLVEAPEGRKYFDLIEIYDGQRHAQSAAGSTTELAVRSVEDLAGWDNAQAYRLTLGMTPTGVVGKVASVSGGPEWRKAYTFGERRAVRQGRPALVASAAEGRFSRFAVAAGKPTPGSSISVRQGRAGTVAILKSRRGPAPGVLVQELERAGLAVTQVGWDDLARRRLPDDKLDLFILADARELPVQARDTVERLLSCGGKVMAIGAPAASSVKAHTPEGWVDQAGWTEATARRIERVPIQVSPGAWIRTAYRESRRSSIGLDPTSGDGCWKIATDLEGWDGWLTNAPGMYGDGRSLMVVEAKGDAATSQLAIECVEQDSSRWIAVIPLTTGWTTHILRPDDFAYWMDSSAVGRGASGDRLRPGRVARLAFVLSASHTPKVKPGPHTFWIRGLATAAEPGDRPPIFGVTDVEALWPSYKLYPMDQIATLRAAAEQGIVARNVAARWSRPGFSPVWRERGRGFDRGRAWRWVPILEAYDAKGRKRGALVSLMVGDASSPNAMWANVAVADPRDADQAPLVSAIAATARAMVGGICLLEGGAEQFAYRPGEAVRLGAKALNAGARSVALAVRVTVTDAARRRLYASSKPLKVATGTAHSVEWLWRPKAIGAAGCRVAVELLRAGRVVDRIEHRIEALRTAAARPDEFVRVEGSGFVLGGKPWHFQGINYWPTWMAGYPNLHQRTRECYDPEIIERDLAWLKKAGVNVLSAIQAIMPPDPDDPKGYRDQLDFLDRCLKHGIRCYVTLHAGRAYAGASFARTKEYIEKAGLRNHPAVMCWELAWEPIDGPWGGRLDYIGADWNRWIVEQYGDVAGAARDWGYDPRAKPTDPVPVPTIPQCTTDGPWKGYVAAFARAHSDLIGRAYGEVVRPLRAWDPNHLITFRGGACGIPSGAAFAHIHSVGVARHMDFLCPEGYNLQTGGWANPTPADDIRKGGLVTLYYRHVSRDKPIVWMEFGYTANGFGGTWSPERIRLKPDELIRQRDEVERFYAMIVESGSRGAAPWWLPGGFRLGENSDFGLVEPDGTERPSARVMAAYNPRFASVRHPVPNRTITVDLDAARFHAWETYSPSYLEIVKAGGIPGLVSAGTGTTSADCPLVAVGGATCNGMNPPQFLNSEFDALEIGVGDTWRVVRAGDTVEVPRGSVVRCRAQVGNTAEAAWLSPGRHSGPGGVYLTASGGTRAPIVADAPYLGTARIAEFTVIADVKEPTTVTFRMEAEGRTPFGERRTLTLMPK